MFYLLRNNTTNNENKNEVKERFLSEKRSISLVDPFKTNVLLAEMKSKLWIFNLHWKRVELKQRTLGRVRRGDGFDSSCLHKH